MHYIYRMFIQLVCTCVLIFTTSTGEHYHVFVELLFGTSATIIILIIVIIIKINI